MSAVKLIARLSMLGASNSRSDDFCRDCKYFPIVHHGNDSGAIFLHGNSNGSENRFAAIDIFFMKSLIRSWSLFVKILRAVCHSVLGENGKTLCSNESACIPRG